MDATSLGFYSRAYSLMQLPLSFFGRPSPEFSFLQPRRCRTILSGSRRAFLTTFSLSVAVSLADLARGCDSRSRNHPRALRGEVGGDDSAPADPRAIRGVSDELQYGGSVRPRARTGYRLLLSQVIYGALVVGGSWWAGSVWGLKGVAWAVGGAMSRDVAARDEFRYTGRFCFILAVQENFISGLSTWIGSCPRTPHFNSFDAFFLLNLQSW